MQDDIQVKILAELRAELAHQPLRKSKLAAHDDLIVAMRQEGATWRTISRYLAKAGVSAYPETVRSYWHRHHSPRRRSAATPASNPKPQKNGWTFNPPSTLE